MSNDLNRCEFIGRLGKDVEMRFAISGKAIANFSIAVGSHWKDKNTGEDKEVTEWINITAFEKLGEICGKYLTKGSQVYISGRMKTEKYTDANGIEKYSTKIIAETMQMFGGKKDEENNASTNTKPIPQNANQKIQYHNSKSNVNYLDDDLSDVPF